MSVQIESNEYAEDAAILRFYNVDSFEPDIWVDDPDAEPVSQQETTKQQFERRGEASQQQQIPSASPSDHDIQASMDISDPLGLLPSIFEKESGPKPSNFAGFKEKSTLMISNKNFNPRQFLLQVHKDASYNDLVLGEKRLRQGVDKRAEALKSLVHNNFDRFVTAKNTMDHVYEEMKSLQLNEIQEYGTRALRLALEDANKRADQIYGPVVERRQRVDKVRSTLSILQQYKFFFNLPSSLLEAIKQNKYETAIRDYKKGKYVYQTLKTNSISDLQSDTIPNNIPEDNLSGFTNMHRKVFDKVWSEVTKIIGELQNVLLKMLADPWRSMDEQEKTINYLFELDTKEDPAWFYLDSQYQWIMGLMKETFATNVEKVDKIKNSNVHIKESVTQRSLSLKHAISVIESKSLSLDTEGDLDLRTWKAISEIVNSLSSLLVRCLPDFWRLSKAFIEGKFKNKSSLASSEKGGGSRRGRRANVDLSKVEQCQSMSRNIVDKYASLLSSYFTLDHIMDIHDSDNEKYKDDMPSFLPLNTNSIHVSESLTRMMTTLSNCINDLNNIHLPGEAFAGLTDLLEKARSKFIDVICLCWERDAKNFYYLEDWVLDPYNPQYTGLLKRYYDYHKFCARSAHKVASMTVISEGGGGGVRNVDSVYVDKIRSSFLESTFAFLDGLVQLAFADYKPLNEKEELLLAKKREKIDVHSVDVRVLLTVSNLAHMRSAVIRKLVTLFESAYKVNMEEDYKTLIDVVDQLDLILFGDYIKRKSAVIRDIIHHGILMSGIDWYSISKPTDVHSFVYEALMTLVMVHSQISSVAKQLVHRALSFLLETMANDCLESFRQVERFGMGGMLQATLETEFMHQTLSQYVTPAASETLQQIYQTIEQAFDQQQQHAGSLDAELGHVKELLVYSRKSTVVQFLCFKPNKERHAGNRK
ncbi:exocyst complex component Sec5-domain-containing protein [Halteromyces radiatus]|uniref:exocyst complex component Sec5-domain-containing protein n=1 Tax=Halteromyces radiatus TaxID=101107 RepID=UPI0022203645|nr:exocyst complex component Sec5-domain-containing protein [Halteromyces radiatus]KAI8083026.1 exocyst complex component Sec5-domain-containing protein [Halteromyces radiatus]